MFCNCFLKGVSVETNHLQVFTKNFLACLFVFFACFSARCFFLAKALWREELMQRQCHCLLTEVAAISSLPCEIKLRKCTAVTRLASF